MDTEVINYLKKGYKGVAIHTDESVKKISIQMKNFYLTPDGSVYKKQILDSHYVRNIKEKVKDIFDITHYTCEDVVFKNMLPKKPMETWNWSFAKGLNFDSFIAFSDEWTKEFYKENRDQVKKEFYESNFISAEQVFRALPKLPSVYLVVMQVFDILAFERYQTYINTHAARNGHWEMDQWVKIVPSEFEYMNKSKIGMGLYSNKSFFKDSHYYMKLTGYSMIGEKLCAVFNYYCDFSKVMMSEKDNGSIRRSGTSYYHGQLWVDAKTNDLLRATMEENYIAVQEGKKKVPVNIKRRVLYKLLEG